MPDKNTVYRYLDEDVSDVYALARRHIWLNEHFNKITVDSTVWTVVVGGYSTVSSNQRSDNTPVYLSLDALSGVLPRRAQIYSGKLFNIAPGAFTAQKQYFSKVTASWFACWPDTISDYKDLYVTMGFTPTSGLATDNNIAVFAKILGVLYARTDSNGTDEDTNISSGITLANWNKYTIEVTSASVKFYVNDALKATHATQKPQYPMVLNLMSGAVAGTVHARLYIANPVIVYEV